MLLTCSSPPTYTSNQAVAKQKVSDDSLKAITDELPDVEPTVKTFTDMRKMLMLLSNVGIGHVRSWRSDELGYMSSTHIMNSELRSKMDSEIIWLSTLNRQIQTLYG